MNVSIIIDKTNWQFIEKEDPINVEVINLTTKEIWKGSIISISSNGKYTIELKERVENK